MLTACMVVGYEGRLLGRLWRLETAMALVVVSRQRWRLFPPGSVLPGMGGSLLIRGGFPSVWIGCQVWL